MIPTSAITVKTGTELQNGEIGLLLARGTTFPVIGGVAHSDVPVAVLFDGEVVRLEPTQGLREPVLILKGAEIEVDPQSARQASLGAVLGCPIISDAGLFIEADFKMDFFQIAIGHVDENAAGHRLAFQKWRIVLRHGDAEYEILSRSPAAE